MGKNYYKCQKQKDFPLILFMSSEDSSGQSDQEFIDNKGIYHKNDQVGLHVLKSESNLNIFFLFE